jgi:hypothetical protein
LTVAAAPATAGLLRAGGGAGLEAALAVVALGLVALAIAGVRPDWTLAAALALLAGGVGLAAHDGDTSQLGLVGSAAGLVAAAECTALALRLRRVATVERRAALLAASGVVLTSLTAAGLAGIVLLAGSLPSWDGLPQALCGGVAIAGLARIAQTVAQRRKT